MYNLTGQNTVVFMLETFYRELTDGTDIDISQLLLDSETFTCDDIINRSNLIVLDTPGFDKNYFAELLEQYKEDTHCYICLGPEAELPAIAFTIDDVMNKLTEMEDTPVETNTDDLMSKLTDIETMLAEGISTDGGTATLDEEAKKLLSKVESGIRQVLSNVAKDELQVTVQSGGKTIRI